MLPRYVGFFGQVTRQIVQLEGRAHSTAYGLPIAHANSLLESPLVELPIEEIVVFLVPSRPLGPEKRRDHRQPIQSRGRGCPGRFRGRGQEVRELRAVAECNVDREQEREDVKRKRC